MFQQQQNPQRQQFTRGVALATTAVLSALVLGTGAVPAAARLDPGPAAAAVGRPGGCLLERVGTQYVRWTPTPGTGCRHLHGSPSGEPTRHHDGGPEPTRVRGSLWWYGYVGEEGRPQWAGRSTLVGRSGCVRGRAASWLWRVATIGRTPYVASDGD
jgi:hypothetical protein